VKYDIKDKSVVCIFLVVLLSYLIPIYGYGDDSLALPKPLKGYYNIAVVGDPHLPGRHLLKKESAVDTINNQKDVDEVVVVGDLCETTGTKFEFNAARRFLTAFRKPLNVINGNHDFVFANKQSGQGHLSMAGKDERQTKLNRFRGTYGKLSTDKVVRVKTTEGEYSYHLVFLGVDSLTSPYYCCLSEKTQKWLKKSLEAHKDIPTIVFCHSPLWGKQVLSMNPKFAYYVTQPVDYMESLIKNDPTVFLWVAGHCHLGVNNPLATGKLNYFNKQVYTVNNCDLDGRSILAGMDINLEYHSDMWTKSLLLYPHKVVIKIYDHIAARWLDEKEQTIKVRR